MTRLAFYAPMKSPRSPIPSGDREMARNLMAALEAGGATVDLVSELRVHDKTGDPDRQAEARHAAQREIARLSGELRDARPALWVTYHNYYKAPDLIGPEMSRILGIPYVQIESTRARKRLTGPWARFAEAAEAACDAARVIFYLTSHDLITLKRHRADGQRLVRLRPFLPVETLPPPSSCDGPMLAAGMMRSGDKLDSYRIIAETLALLPGDWPLNIAGDGPARAEVEALMAPFAGRVRFLGQLDRAAMQRAYGRASLLLWPGAGEAFGMVYLEAQAAGVPVVAQNRPGVRDVVLPGPHPAPREGAAALAARVQAFLDNASLRRQTGAAAREMVARKHLMGTATRRLWKTLTPLLEAAP